LTQLSDSLVVELVPAPRPASGICPTCRTWNDRPGEAICGNCSEVEEALGEPAVALDVISLYRKPSQLRDWLTSYKGRIDDSEPYIREYEKIVGALIFRFLREYAQNLLARAGGLDGLVVVPSTARRVGFRHR
jgi:hypothetical protein